MSVYLDVILDHFRNPRNFGRIKNAANSTVVFNAMCGDRIELDVAFRNGVVSEIKFMGKGCAISKAASSMLTEYATGKSKDLLKKLDKTFMIKMLNIDLGPNRLKCALLPLEALNRIILKSKNG